MFGRPIDLRSAHEQDPRIGRDVADRVEKPKRSEQVDVHDLFRASLRLRHESNRRQMDDGLDRRGPGDEAGHAVRIREVKRARRERRLLIVVHAAQHLVARLGQARTQMSAHEAGGACDEDSSAHVPCPARVPRRRARSASTIISISSSKETSGCHCRTRFALPASPSNSFTSAGR